VAPKAISTGTISFGLVAIPVRLFSTANPNASVSFRLLSPEGHRLKQQYVDPAAGDKIVPRKDMIKGYEVAKDRFVTFSEDELRELQEKSTQTIEIAEFVPEDQVPRFYVSKSYYLGPDRGGDRPYKLLSRALRETKRCALAKYAARGKMYLVLIAPRDDGLVMHQLHYADEIVSFDEVPKGDAEPKEGELDLAVKLIEQLANDRFEPEKYEDEVRTRIMEAIEQKTRGEELTMSPDEAPKAQVIDLMDALKASLGTEEETSKGSPKKSSRRKKTGSKKAKSS
jgi:DNA end-binding protein Ku